MVIISASQAEDAGSIPVTCSIFLFMRERAAMKRKFIEGDIYGFGNILLKIIVPEIRSVNPFLDGNALVFFYPENHKGIADLIVYQAVRHSVLGVFAKKKTYIANEPLSPDEKCFDAGIIITSAGEFIPRELYENYSSDHAVVFADDTDEKCAVFPIYDIYGNIMSRVPKNLLTDCLIEPYGIELIAEDFNNGRTVTPCGHGIFFGRND